MAAKLAIGIMSGTSLDGADAVLAMWPDAGPPGLVAHVHRPFDAALGATLFELQSSGPDELERASRAALGLAQHYAAATHALLEKAGVTPTDVAVIGAHGQTVRHHPEAGYTIQLLAPAALAEATGIDVVADFRSADIAAGGQGAPLVPGFHADVFRSSTEHRAVLNLGGIANLTDLPVAPAPVRGWDCGPANVLLDEWAARHGKGAFDRDGAWARSGKVDAALLKRLLQEPYLRVDPPKSTGRDLFNAAWLARMLGPSSSVSAADVAATLVEFTAQAVAESLQRHIPQVELIIVCGGGTFNSHLMARLGAAVRAQTGRAVRLAPSSDHGIAPDHVEALAFAWMALRRLARVPASLGEVTGADGARVLGAHYVATRHRDKLRD